MFKHILFTGLFLFIGQFLYSQNYGLEIAPDKELAVTPFLIAKHQGEEGLAEFKKNQPHAYLKELWYYAESYYIKQDHFSQGDKIPFGLIDISRFESQRQEREEVQIVLPGYRDILVLLPNAQLIYKPE